MGGMNFIDSKLLLVTFSSECLIREVGSIIEMATGTMSMHMGEALIIGYDYLRSRRL